MFDWDVSFGGFLFEKATVILSSLHYVWIDCIAIAPGRPVSNRLDSSR